MIFIADTAHRGGRRELVRAPLRAKVAEADGEERSDEADSREWPRGGARRFCVAKSSYHAQSACISSATQLRYIIKSEGLVYHHGVGVYKIEGAKFSREGRIYSFRAARGARSVRSAGEISPSAEGDKGFAP